MDINLTVDNVSIKSRGSQISVDLEGIDVSEIAYEIGMENIIEAYSITETLNKIAEMNVEFLKDYVNNL
jgi:hypothetical protein